MDFFPEHIRVKLGWGLLVKVTREKTHLLSDYRTVAAGTNDSKKDS